MTGPRHSESREWTLELPGFTRPPLSLNRRLHWAAERRERQHLAHAVGWMAKANKLPRGLDRVRVELHWQPAITRRRDTDNPSPSLKVAIDALTVYGLTVDDDSTHVESDCVIHNVAKPARVWLTISDLSAVRPGGTPK